MRWGVAPFPSGSPAACFCGRRAPDPVRSLAKGNTETCIVRTMYEKRGRRERDREWDAELVRRLRRHLAMTQREFATELNSRQQTVSEWETGRYRPRGPSARLLTLIAEEATFVYQAGDVAGAGSVGSDPDA